MDDFDTFDEFDDYDDNLADTPNYNQYILLANQYINKHERLNSQLASHYFRATQLYLRSYNSTPDEPPDATEIIPRIAQAVQAGEVKIRQRETLPLKERAQQTENQKKNIRYETAPREVQIDDLAFRFVSFTDYLFFYATIREKAEKLLYKEFPPADFEPITPEDQEEVSMYQERLEKIMSIYTERLVWQWLIGEKIDLILISPEADVDALEREVQADIHFYTTLAIGYGAEIDVPIKLARATFHSLLVLDRTQFAQPVNFDRATFLSAVWIEADFRSTLSFKNAYFYAHAHVKSTNLHALHAEDAQFFVLPRLDTDYLGAAHFHRTIFGAILDFESLRGLHFLDLSHSRYGEGQSTEIRMGTWGSFYFVDTEFNQPTSLISKNTSGSADNHLSSVHMQNVTANDHFLLQGGIFYAPIRLKDCEFLGRVEIKNATFQNDVVWQKASFYAGVEITDSTFETYLKVLDSELGDHWSMNNCTITGDLEVAQTEFPGTLEFTRSELTQVRFSDCRFHGDASYNRLDVKEAMSFSDNCEFHSEAAFVYATFRGALSFNEQRFHQRVQFSGSRMECGLVFIDTTLDHTPELITTQFSVPPDLSGLNIKTPIPKGTFGKKALILANKYRRLKELAISATNTEGALNFFAGELRCASLAKKWDISEKALFFLFTVLCDLGRDYVLPLFWLIQLGLSFGILFASAQYWGFLPSFAVLLCFLYRYWREPHTHPTRKELRECGFVAIVTGILICGLYAYGGQPIGAGLIYALLVIITLNGVFRILAGAQAENKELLPYFENPEGHFGGAIVVSTSSMVLMALILIFLLGLCARNLIRHK